VADERLRRQRPQHLHVRASLFRLAIYLGARLTTFFTSFAERRSTFRFQAFFERTVDSDDRDETGGARWSLTP
jgi:hypothetical protein